MVFSRGCSLGEAKVIRCKHCVSSGADITAEAESLWGAERCEEPNGHVSASWGSVALLIRPDAEVPEPILDEWANRVCRERDYGRIPQMENEGNLVDERGILHIPWPQLLERERPLPVPVDLLLATATRPTLGGRPAMYATAEMIARAWGIDAHDRVAYFRNNRLNGIRTFQDQAILEEIRTNYPAQANGVV